MSASTYGSAVQPITRPPPPTIGNAAAGGSLADIGHLTLLVQDYADLPAIDGYWKRTFPDPNDRPARQVMKLGTQGRSHVQFHVLAAI